MLISQPTYFQHNLVVTSLRTKRATALTRLLLSLVSRDCVALCACGVCWSHPHLSTAALRLNSRVKTARVLEQITEPLP